MPPPPKEPEKPKVEPDPGEYDSGGNRGCFIIALIASIIGFIAVLSSDFDNKGSIILPGIVCIAMLFFLLKTTSWDKESNEQKRKAHRESLSSLPERQAKYEKEYAAYIERKEKYDELKQKRLSEEFISTYRKQLIKEWRKDREKPEFVDYDEDDKIKRGPAEAFFHEQFSDNVNVYVNKKIPVGDKYYYPDLLLECDGLYIDIEIDEPYAGNDGTPIHYVEEEYGFVECVDDDRNEYLTDMGFEVVRFSEEQIFLHVDECFDYLNNLLEGILLGNINVEANDIIKTKKWTKEEANKMAYKRFRNTYVPAKYHSMIDKEDKHSYEEFREEFN